MRPGESFPDDQAYIEITDAFLESLAGLTEAQRVDVLAEVVNLCRTPGGNHTLSNRGSQRLAGFNTVDVLAKEYRVVFSSTVEVVEGRHVGHVRVLVCGPRRGDAAYDIAESLRASGRFSDDEMQEIWEALAFLDVVAEDVGMDGWDYRPEPAPEGMVKAAVAAGLIDQDVAENLSVDELQAAMEEGWGSTGPDQGRALAAAARRARGAIEGLDFTRIFKGRRTERCGAVMKRTRQKCIRRAGHPGPHRASR